MYYNKKEVKGKKITSVPLDLFIDLETGEGNNLQN
jgi:hypothetical protein